jgi:hypothetical protein
VTVAQRSNYCFGCPIAEPSHNIDNKLESLGEVST